MAHKTFISYKYSEAQRLRDDIIAALGDDATYYKGETSDSPDLTDTSTENIKRNLRNMMYDTSVTIVIISPNMKKSKWIDWEIEYCLKNNTRKNRTSHTNGVVGVIMKYNGGYDWFKTATKHTDALRLRTKKNWFTILLTTIVLIKTPKYIVAMYARQLMHCLVHISHM